MKAVIAAYARSPFHFAKKGALAGTRPESLAAQIVKGLMQRITGKATALLARTGGRYALATQCIGGGQGIATVLESLQ